MQVPYVPYVHHMFNIVNVSTIYTDEQQMTQATNDRHELLVALYSETMLFFDIYLFENRGFLDNEKVEDSAGLE